MEGGTLDDETTTYKAYRCRLYPKPAQEAYFRRMFSCCRTVYNHFLQVRMEAYEERKTDPDVRVPSRFDMCRMLTSYKKTELDKNGRAYLKDVDSTSLVYEIQHLDDAFRRFFQRIRQGRRDAGYPRFKGRGDKDSCTVAFKRLDVVEKNKIRFAKIGWVNASVWRTPQGVPVSCTISVDASGRWWASILCKDVPEEPLPPAQGTVVVNADEHKLEEDPAFEKRLRREERKLARRMGSPKGSKSARYKKQMRKLARLRAKETDRDRTRASQIASSAVKEAGTIVLVESSEPDSFDKALERELAYRCAASDRELIKQEIPAEEAEDSEEK